MIKAETKYSLEGAFRIKTYDANDNLIEDTENFNNFITQSGLSYPAVYSFADCFRFLSLGQGTVASSATGSVANGRTPTTGLQNYINSNGLITLSDGSLQSTVYMGRQQYFGGAGGACGTILQKGAVSLYRGWQVPSGGKLTSSAVSINEFGVSPSSGSDTSGNIMFSRVVRSVIIPQNSRSIISYQLQIKLQNTGATIFNSGTFLTGSSNVDNDLGIVTEWQNLSGFYKTVFPGIRFVDVQGSTYCPKYGDGFEPSRVDSTKLVTYFSPDNSEFDVSTTGANQLSEASAYASDGLSKVFFGQNLAVDAGRTSESDLSFYSQGDLTVTSLPPSDPNDPILNLRLKNINVPDISNYNLSVSSIDYSTYATDYLTRAKPISVATFGASGVNNNLINLGNKAVLSSLTINLPYTYSGFRTQRVSRKQFFCPVNSLGYNSRFGSFVIAFQNGTTYYPYVDGLLYDNSGRAMMSHYRKFSGIQFSDFGSGNPAGYIQPNIGLGLWSGLLMSNGTSVTGVTGNGAIDYGLVDHSLTSNSTPSTSGDLWFPQVYNGSVMQLTVPNCTYTNSGLTISDPNYYFKTGGQMINNLVFRPVASGDWTTNQVYTWANRIANQTPQLSGQGATFWNGIYLTKALYTGGDVFPATKNAQDNFRQDVGLGSARYANLRITGYIGYRNNITPNCLPGTVTLNTLPSTYLSTFTPNIQSVNISYATLTSGTLVTQGLRIQDIFSGVSLTSRLSGSGFTYDSGSSLSFGITGLISDVENGNAWLPVYISQMTGDYLNGPFPYSWIANSSHSGEVLMTRFKQPTGKFIHSESFRLLPNYAYPSTTDSYPTPVSGGTYPALSFDNTLEEYINLMWSASCGAALDCVEP